MKYFLSLILIILINLPSCRLVFASMVDMEMHHSQGEMISMNMEEGDHDEIVNGDIPNTLNCCLNSSQTSLEKNIVESFTLKSHLGMTHAMRYSWNNGVIPDGYIPLIYRLDSPPDPSEYISLIGTSVKNLN